MAQAPVAAQADAERLVVHVGPAQRLLRLREAPAVHHGVGGGGADAGDFGKTLEQLGLDALGIVFKVFGRPLGAGLDGPALDGLAPRLAVFAREPADAVVDAARGVPLRTDVRQAGLHGLGVGDHERPAGGHLHRGEGLAQLGRVAGDQQQVVGLQVRNGEHHAVEATEHVLAAFDVFGAQLPLLGIQHIAFDVGDAGFGERARGQVTEEFGVGQRLDPVLDQTAHAGCGHEMRFGRRRGTGQHMTEFVEHAHRVRTPGAHHGLCGLQCLGEALVAHREVLRTVVEAAEFAAAGGHAATEAAALFKQGDAVTRLQQRARAGHAGHAGAHHRDVHRGRFPGLGGAGRLARDGCGRGAGFFAGGHVSGRLCCGTVEVDCSSLPVGVNPGCIKSGDGCGAGRHGWWGAAGAPATSAAPARCRPRCVAGAMRRPRGCCGWGAARSSRSGARH